MERAWQLSPVAKDGGLMVLVEWPSGVAYEGWLNNPVRAELNAEMAAYVRGEMTGGAFVVASERA